MNVHPLEGAAVRLPLITGHEAKVMVDGGTLDLFAEGYPRQEDIDAATTARSARSGSSARPTPTAEAAGAQVIAHTAGDNIAGQRTLVKCGFVRADVTNAHGEWRYVRRQ